MFPTMQTVFPVYIKFLFAFLYVYLSIHHAMPSTDEVIRYDKSTTLEILNNNVCLSRESLPIPR